jgi:hypothetical protein
MHVVVLTNVDATKTGTTGLTSFSPQMLDAALAVAYVVP